MRCPTAPTWRDARAPTRRSADLAVRVSLLRSPARARRLSARLEQLDRIAGGVVDDDLLSSGTLEDVAAEVDLRVPQPLDLGRQVLDVDDDAIPAARLGLPPVTHGLRGATRAVRRAQDQLQ